MVEAPFNILIGSLCSSRFILIVGFGFDFNPDFDLISDAACNLTSGLQK
jgi:hypothetical protein